MATTKRKLRVENQDEGQGQSKPASNRGGAQAAQQRRELGGAQPSVKQSARQGGGLLNMNAEQLARGLGFFSLGLGFSEFLAPRAIAKISGVEEKNTGLIRLMGLREILHGLGIFAQGKRPAEAMWARVAGDALDLAALGRAFASPKSGKGRLAFATANVLAVTALDLICAQALSANNQTPTGGTYVKKSIIIDKTPEELYQFWHNFENLPTFMKHLESVRVTGEGRSHWVAKAPAGSSVEWDAQITEDRPNELIAWRSLEGADVDNSGNVRFERAPGGRGTIVKVDVEYNPPGGVVGSVVAKLFGEEPGQQIYDDLRCLKQVMEVGEVIVSDGTLWDNGLLTQRAAQPASGKELSQAQGAD
ncbi:MAG TPA: SRPBCC family protein [Pyrinomonadaceae bacterium]|nr:SRPBCC family protein [Pyrinomonadaceae bacterium]